MARLASFFSLILATSAVAQPQITSVRPSSGPVAGGTSVIIRGSGFDTTCPPAPQPCGRTAVVFGGIDAVAYRLIDSKTIEAVTPPSFPGETNVGVVFANGGTTLRNAFTYTGEVSDAFERVLLPIFTPPVTGSFGSKFYTFFAIWNIAGPDIPAFGLAPRPCDGIGECVPPSGPRVSVLKARYSAPNAFAEPLGNPGYFFFIPKGAFDRIAASLRVADFSRQDESFGTRIPIVPEREFRSDFIALIDVPVTPRFRNMLRVYSLDPQTCVKVRVIRHDSTKIYSEVDLDLPNPADTFHPGYAELSDFGNIPPDRVRIEIEPHSSSTRIWAFVSVTNNVTQQITVVTPR